MATEYISEVQLPGDANYKKVKDSEARSLISTCQSNILYTINTGVKNIAFLKNGTYLSASGGAETTFVVENGVVTVTSTVADTRATIMNYVTLEAGTYIITNRQEDGYDVRLRYNGIDYNNTFTINSATTFEVRAYSYKVLTNATITPLLCIKSVYDLDSSYQPPALPNYDLTRLESEDRASLAEVVDSGAKNKLQYDLTSLKAANTDGTWNNNVYTVLGISFTVNSDLTISVSGTRTSTTGNAILNLSSYTANSNDVLSQGVTYSNCYLYARGGSTNCSSASSIAILPNDIGVSRTYAIAVPSAVTQAVSVKIYPMICTKAAFGVSNKFVPYTKSNSQLTTELGSVKTVLEAIL